MKEKVHRHSLSLHEELTEPSLQGVRTVPRQKRQVAKEGDADDAFAPPQLCSVIYDEAKQQRNEIAEEARNIHSSLPPSGSSLLANSIKAAFAKIKRGEGDDDLEMQSDEPGFEEECLGEISEHETAAITNIASTGNQSFTDVVFEKIENIKKLKNKTGGKPPDGISPKIMKLYEGIGDFFSRYTTGRIPRAFRFVPNLTNWEEVIYLTRPDRWTPHAYLIATKVFLNNNPQMAQRFMCRILLPHFRQEIERKQKLHLVLYETLKHTCTKAGAFYKGIIIPLCRSGTCTVREAVIFSSVMKRASLPVQHSAAALLCLAEMPYSGPTSFFIQILIGKKYVLPFKAVDGLVEHFVRFTYEERELPAIWHQSLLTFVQSYKQHMKKEDLADIGRLAKKQHHSQISGVILKEIESKTVRAEIRIGMSDNRFIRQEVEEDVEMDE